MASNPFTTEDLYKDTGGLGVLVKDLTAINGELNKIEKIAADINKGLNGLSVAKSGDRKQLEALDAQMVKLAKTHEALLIAKLKTEQQALKNQKVESELVKVRTNAAIADQKLSKAEVEVIKARTTAEVEAKKLAREEVNLATARDRSTLQALRTVQAQEKANAAAAKSSIPKLTREQQLAAQAAQAAAGAYDQLKAQLAINIIRSNQMSAAQRENTKEGRALTKQIASERAELERIDKERGTSVRRVGSYGDAIKELGRSLKGLILTYISLSGAQRLVDTIFTQTKALNSLDVALKLTTGSEKAAAEAKAFLSDLTERLGIDLLKTTQSYLKFGVAAKNAGFSQNTTNEIFESFGKVASTIGLRADELDGVFKALEQIMSKGTVQAEELRGQLGDRLPGAFIILADSMGITTEELNKQLKAGKVLANDVLPKFAKQAEIAYGVQNIDRVDNLAAAQGRFNRAVTLVIEKLDASGAFKNFFNALTKGITVIGDNIGAILSLGKAILTLAAAYAVWRTSLFITNGLMKLALADSIKDITFKNLQAAASLRLATAQKALNTAMKANPIGLILTAAIALVGVFNLLSNKFNSTRELQESLNEAQKQASSETAVQRHNLNKLISEYSKLEKELATTTKGTKEHKKVIGEMNGVLKEFDEAAPDRLKSLKAEEVQTINLTNASNDFITSLENRIKARILEDKIAQALIERSNLQDQIAKGGGGKGDAYNRVIDNIFGTTLSIAGAKERVADLDTLIKDLGEKAAALDELNKKDIATETGGGGDGTEDKTLLDSFQRRRELNKLIDDERTRELDALKIDEDEKIALFKKNGIDTLALTEFFEKERLAIIQKYRLLAQDAENQAIDSGEAPLLIQEEAARKLAEAIIESKKKIAAQNAKEANAEYERRRNSLEAEKDHQVALFDLSKATELEKAQFRIDAEIKLYQDLLDAAKAFNKDLSKEQIAGIENAIELLRAKRDSLGDGGEGPQDIYDLLGIKFDDDPEKDAKAKAAISGAFDFAKEQLQSYFDLQKELADQAIEDADRRVNAAETALDRELGLMRDGYAHRVENARKELDLAKKQQEAVLKDRQKFLKAQLAINTALEASNLIVAVAKILGPEGPPFPFNLAAVAVMLGSFALAKAKAFKLASQQPQQFGEGGFEELGGGSHASGNDTDLGFTTKSGKRAHGEKGEGVGIYSRKAMARYGKEIKYVTYAINKGMFHDVYMKRQERAIAGLHVVSNQISTQKMEEKLDAIRYDLRNHSKYRNGRSMDKDGNIIEERETGGGYRKTIFRRS